MKRILVTGATGNVGRAVVKYLTKCEGIEIVVGARVVEEARKQFTAMPDLQYVAFDFENPNITDWNQLNIDRLFLLRPPHLADVNRYFEPLLRKMKEANVKDIVFLSVQGAERSSVIPHHKMEVLIKGFDFDYILLRPGYFMQNLTTTLWSDIKRHRQIVLPAGHAKFNWVDVENIGELACYYLTEFENFRNSAFEITGSESKSFGEAVTIVNSIVAKPLRYRNMNPIRFYFRKKREGMKSEMIFVLILLHFLPRFQKAPKISDVYQRTTGKLPTTLAQFVEREKVKLG